MLTRTIGWGVLLLCAVCAIWWWLDPAGFWSNPVAAWLKTLSLRRSGYYR